MFKFLIKVSACGDGRQRSGVACIFNFGLKPIVMKKILVPCDFSDPAVQAFKFAVEVAAKSRGEVHLLHVIELPAMHDSLIAPALSYEEAFLKEAKVQVTRDFTKMRTKWAKDIKVKSSIEYGSVTATIHQYIQENKIDLVVMGTKGATGLKELLIGSNTEKIVRKSKVPVIAVKKYLKASSIKNIVFPNTLGKDQEELTLKVKFLQDFFKARLHLVYINTPGNFKRDWDTHNQLKDFAKRFMIRNYSIHIYNDYKEEDGVVNFTKEIGGDLIAMATHGRRGISHLMSGSIAEDVVNHVDCPIWTCAIN